MRRAGPEAQVGNYRIARLINRGGQGSVYLGYDSLLRRQVAIKIYNLPGQRSARKQLIAEAQLIASLDSPKIVPVYDVIESGSHLAMVMAYVPGCSLEEFLDAARPSLESIITVVTDVAGALAVARQRLIVHGDVKPANVLLGEDGHARLTDFGISRDQTLPAQLHPGAGSYWSLTPEHLREETVGQQADIFALGVLLYRMLSLQHPFAPDDGPLNTVWMLEHDPLPLTGRVPPEFEVPPALEALIGHMLHKDPRQRPGNTRGIRQVLREVSRELPMTVGSVLLRESRPFFRPESPEDVPPDIPSELARSGRSRLNVPTRWHRRVFYWLAGLRRMQQIVLCGGVALAVALMGLLVANAVDTTVTFTEPKLRISADVFLPPPLGGRWLSNQLRDSVQSQLGQVRVVDSEGADPNVVYSDLARSQVVSPPGEQFGLALQCNADLCMITVTRDTISGRRSERTALFTDATLEEWEDAVRSLVRRVL